MVHARLDFFDFDIVLFEEFDLLRMEVVLLITVAKSANFLRVHPIEEASLAGIPPSVHVAIFGESDRVILTEGNIDHFLFSLDEIVYELWVVEAGVLLVALAQHTPVAAAEQIQLAIG